MKNVLITGATGGIGSAIAAEFAKEGFNVAIHTHSKPEKGQRIADELAQKYSIKTISVCSDVSSQNSVREMFDTIEKEFGQIDILVNNAGIAQQKLFTDITADEWYNMMGVNLDGAFFCSQEVLKRYMLKNHSGAILNISSMWGQVGASCEVHYSAAKAGIIGLTKALAKEVGLSGIRVNCICPGVVMTDMVKSFDKDTMSALKEETPLNTLGTPQDIADAIVFLCSSKAKFITGQIIGVNGGFVI